MVYGQQNSVWWGNEHRFSVLIAVSVRQLGYRHFNRILALNLGQPVESTLMRALHLCQVLFAVYLYACLDEWLMTMTMHMLICVDTSYGSQLTFSVHTGNLLKFDFDFTPAYLSHGANVHCNASCADNCTDLCIVVHTQELAVMSSAPA